MRRKLSNWHQRIGLISLGLLSWLAVTGVLLNHADHLGLDRPIGAPLVARLYGIEADCSDRAWDLAGQTLVDCGDTVLLASQPLDALQGPVHGGLVWRELGFVATAQGLLLLGPQGERVEWVASELLPGRPLRLGLLPQQLVLQTPAGIFASDENLNRWTSVDPDSEVVWSRTRQLDPSQRDQAQALAAVRQLSWTKLLQDLHSGRIIGLAGRILADLGALSILILALLGLILSQGFSRKRPRRAAAPTDAERDDTPSV